MASTKNRGSSGKRQQTKNTSTSTQRSRVSQKEKKVAATDSIRDEVILIVTFLISLLLVLSYFNLCGPFGSFINEFLFGMIGYFTYLFPFALFFMVAFTISNRGSVIARRKVIGSIVLLFALTALIQMICGYNPDMNWFEYYSESSKGLTGGGIIGGTLTMILCRLFGTIAAVIILIVMVLLCIIFITGKAILSLLRKKGEERVLQHKLEREKYVAEYEQIDLEDMQFEQEEKKPRITLGKPMKKKATGTDDLFDEFDTEEEEEKLSFLEELKKKGKSTTASDLEEVQEIPLNRNSKHDVELKEYKSNQESHSFSPSNQMIDEVNSIYEEELKRKFGDGEVASMSEDTNHIPPVVINHDLYSTQSDRNSIEAQNTSHAGMGSEMLSGMDAGHGDHTISQSEQAKNSQDSERTVNKAAHEKAGNQNGNDEMLNISQVVEEKKYEFPPINLLGLPKASPKGSGDRDLKETAIKLQKTLESFGVRVTITNASCGPAVTRYELQPEQGVKVSRITALADDIKLNLAAADIRIEAPIPGKAAVGIEVPNKENSAVMLRELLETKEFTSHSSDLAFAVGKDIGGQAVVTDIAKMPHLLIAGATGSGKSVCINTLIMSILYKANPADVRLIMVDPKVVELSVYNGIPHLLVPVVTDPKKASGALNWAVMEMTDRYKKFADLGVRDLKGYNERVKEVEHLGDPQYQKLPQIVIIVDELADLMMVAPGEVEDAICRLAQMARAAGLHLIIATQRPSVNVITGLIKANVPSRIAFSVSSAIDSRTIIDGSGAEKLLGKGDMLFFPSGYPKPVRVQGAFVSDKEVSAVVEFLKSQGTQHSYSDEISNKISAAQSISPSGGQSANERDDYFIEAGKFIIEKDKASIGMLQRVYKIGFNRAARIMEQLADAGVVGPEEGTKPRKILMSLEEFEQYVDEYV